MTDRKHTPASDLQGPDALEPQELNDCLAAELALGVLEESERAALEARAERDPQFRRLVEEWEARLERLDGEYGSEAPPSSVKASLDAALDAEGAAEFAMPAARASKAPQKSIRIAPPGLVERMWRSVAFWRIATLGSAVAMVLSTIMPGAVAMRRAPENEVLVAAMTTQPGAPQILLVYAPKQGGFHALTLAAGDGGDAMDAMELLLLDDHGGAPMSLGFMTPVSTGVLSVDPAFRDRLVEGARIRLGAESASGLVSVASFKGF